MRVTKISPTFGFQLQFISKSEKIRVSEKAIRKLYFLTVAVYWKHFAKPQNLSIYGTFGKTWL